MGKFSNWETYQLILNYNALAVYFIVKAKIENSAARGHFFRVFNDSEYHMAEQYEIYEIIRVNSESKEHPVANIKKSKGRWETDGEAARALLELSFKKPIQVGGVRVENVNSAFIEILVRNDGDKEFQV